MQAGESAIAVKRAVGRIVFVFLDGVGIGEVEGNPFYTAAMPFVDQLLDGQRPVRHNPRILTEKGVALPVDACLGIAGRPQSATGQAALVSGRNAAHALQEHYGPKPDARIRALLDQGTLFTGLQQAGLSCQSANAYPPLYFAGLRSGKRLLSVFPYALQNAGLALHDAEAYRRGQALAGSITGQDWRVRAQAGAVPVYAPEQAGRLLGRLSRAHAFLFFEHWLTDYQGHKRAYPEAVRHFERIDRFLAGLTQSADLRDTLLIVGSDHGNVEDCRHGRHTRNPALCLMWGAGFRQAAARLEALTDYRPVIERCLAVARPSR